MVEIGGSPELSGAGVTVVVTIPGVSLDVFPAWGVAVFLGAGVGLCFGVEDDVYVFGGVDDFVVEVREVVRGDELE